MVYSYKTIITKLEEMVNYRGLNLELEEVSIGPAENDIGSFNWHSHIRYKVIGQNGKIIISQSLEFQRSTELELKDKIREYNGIFPIENLLSVQNYTPIPSLDVAFLDTEDCEVEMGIKYDGQIEPYSAALYIQGNYEAAFAKLLDILEGGK